MKEIKDWPDKYIFGAKRANLSYSEWLSDWFVGYGKDESCQFEGSWWDMICFARNILASKNTEMAAPEFYKPELMCNPYAEKEPYIFEEEKEEKPNE